MGIYHKTYPAKYRPFDGADAILNQKTANAMSKLYEEKRAIKEDNPCLSPSQKDKCETIDYAVNVLRNKTVDDLLPPVLEEAEQNMNDYATGANKEYIQKRQEKIEQLGRSTMLNELRVPYLQIVKEEEQAKLSAGQQNMRFYMGRYIEAQTAIDDGFTPDKQEYVRGIICGA